MHNNLRRQQTSEALGHENIKEQNALKKSLEKEKTRQWAKTQRKLEIQQSQSYKITKGISTVMDKYFLDAIIGVLPVVGDGATGIFGLPAIYVSAFKVKSLTLTLAVTFNILRDICLGMIPFWVGNIIDAFHRSHLMNFRLIVGFVEDDKEIIAQVNRKAAYSVIGIAICIFVIYLLIKLASSIVSWIGSLF